MKGSALANPPKGEPFGNPILEREMFVELEGNEYYIDGHVDVCPICHKGIDPKILLSIGNRVEDGGEGGAPDVIDIVYRCPIQTCFRVFVVVFVDDGSRDCIFRLKEAFPFVHKDPDIGDEIKKISPNYEKVFTQASAAEGYGLDEVAGVGYRKALEFLIKDYCIHLDPASEQKIKSSLLGNVIAQRVKDENIKDCAKRAAWLGNDETHYERKWQNKDIQDLKNMIKLVVHWIEASLLSGKVKSEMPEKT